MYRSIIWSTQGGSCSALACRSITACRGFGAKVDVARITACTSRSARRERYGKRRYHERDSHATGWFQPSPLSGVFSPSTHALNSLHHRSCSTILGSSSHVPACCAIRLPIQSIVLSAREDSSSLVDSSTEGSDENRTLNVGWTTWVSDVVRVVTRSYMSYELGSKRSNLSSELEDVYLV